MTRAYYGERAACKHCDLDIEFLGKKHGWSDRGLNRFCPNKRILHRPFRESDRKPVILRSAR